MEDVKANPIYTDRERLYLEKLAEMVYQNLHNNDGIYETGFIRAHKDALITLVDAGLMIECDPEGDFRNDPSRVFFAKFRDNWKWWLWRETKEPS